jgi:hypothetical protein
VTGYGRSGSTLLDVLLGRHPSIFGSGEFTSFFGDWAAGRRCACGERYTDCQLWSAAIRDLEAAIPGLEPAQAAKVTRRVEGQKLGSARSADRLDRDREEYGRLWGTTIDAIHRESGRSLIVDSSKSSRTVVRRAEALSIGAGCDVRLIHLVRDPRAVMWSALRAIRNSTRTSDDGWRRNRWGGAFRALLGWAHANASAERTAAALPSAPVIRVRYEDLVRDPQHELERLGGFLGFDLGSVSTAISEGALFDPGHGVSGNSMRRAGPVRLAPDEEWREALPRYARLITACVRPMARKYGYQVG